MFILFDVSKVSVCRYATEGTQPKNSLGPSKGDNRLPPYALARCPCCWKDKRKREHNIDIACVDDRQGERLYRPASTMDLHLATRYNRRTGGHSNPHSKVATSDSQLLIDLATSDVLKALLVARLPRNL
ncbi:hypothetical protein RRG08_030182 [Elysia crispata]|uniref:Uncharacterized protein n=1 Tax=Elysia crispata TaxID=231223 RepID=A0AAE0ZRG3_9GAST|nr:hypothetical protein RRG08_030182 [Elysia crispata]